MKSSLIELQGMSCVGFNFANVKGRYFLNVDDRCSQVKQTKLN